MKTQRVIGAIASTQEKLVTHKIYNRIGSVDDLKLFMENHIYAVWDFMSLLKGLQINLTCTMKPWTPVENTEAARFINEIVLEEETDEISGGIVTSHFELYLESMKEIGAETSQINNFISVIKESSDYRKTINDFNIHADIKSFLNFTFDIIESGESHKIASAFTFGRENVIPDMFIGLVKGLNEKNSDIANKFVYYLERHIELDGDDHGPIALKMIENLCGDDERKWEILSSASCLVSMSEIESFGIVLVEGASMGARIVASDIPSHREISETIGGFDMVDVNDEEGIERSILSNSKGDGSEYSGMANFDWVEITSRYVKMYEKVISKMPA